MSWYCNKCKIIHYDDELCPKIKAQLKTNPKLLSEAANFTTVAGEYALISSQALDGVAHGVNKLAGTNLSYEGTRQFTRYLQVFKRLNEETFSKSGIFSTLENAKNYLENVMKVAETSPKSMTSFESKLTGAGQEVDWVRLKQGQLSSLWEKSSLLNKNAPGVDGVTLNKFNGKTISRTTIKASSFADENTQRNIENNVGKVKVAIEKGNATSNDVIFGTAGTKDAVQKSGLSNPVVEKNTPKKVSSSNERLKQKIMDGQATTNVTVQQLRQKMVQGAIVGAAVGVTISTITNYVRYKNGELSKEDAFKEVSEDTLKGAITGTGMATITIFLPGGVVGLIGGIAIGVYFNKVCTNILDEIYGKGAYGAILDASGYVYGMTFNLGQSLEQMNINEKQVKRNLQMAESALTQTDDNISAFNNLWR